MLLLNTIKKCVFEGLAGYTEMSVTPIFQRENRGRGQQNIFPKVSTSVNFVTLYFQVLFGNPCPPPNLSINTSSHIIHRTHLDKKATSVCRAEFKKMQSHKRYRILCRFLESTVSSYPKCHHNPVFTIRSQKSVPLNYQGMQKSHFSVTL